MDAEDRICNDGVVVWDDQRILYVGDRSSYTPTGDEEWLDGRDQLILPGLINLHTHTPMTALRGLADDVPASRWLPLVIGLEARLTPEEHYWSALAGACELLRRGVTFAADRGSDMSYCSQALWDSGIRAVVTQTLTDRGGRRAWDESEAVLAHWGADPASRIFAALGPHATDSCSEELLLRVRRRMEELGALAFIHVAQSREEVEAVRRLGDAGCVHLLRRLGLLGPKVIAAHCTYLQPGEAEILAATGTRVAHCPVSNAKIEGAVARGWQLWQAGVPLGLGTDCVASNNGMDPWFDLKFAALFHKAATGDPEALPARTALDWVTGAPARCLGLDGQVGCLQPGARADLITLRLDGANAIPLSNPWSHMAYAANGGDVDTVVVDGELVLRRGGFVHLDAERIAHELCRIRAKLTT